MASDTLVERIIDIRNRLATRNADYDTVTEAADRIEALEAALRIEIWNGLKSKGMSDDAAMAMVKTRMSALEGKALEEHQP